MPFSEAIGFVNDLREVENADYGVMHELAHMWWGERITGAQMQGRWMLTENMADYSTLMLFKEYYPPVLCKPHCPRNAGRLPQRQERGE